MLWEEVEKPSLWQDFLDCFTASANKFYDLRIILLQDLMFYTGNSYLLYGRG
jgi:hypothetical protein